MLQNPIKVVHIASGDLWAGAEVQLYNLVKELHKCDDVSVSVILLNHGILEQKLLEKNIGVTVFNEAELSAPHIFRGVLRAVGKERPDLIHTHRFKENIIGSLVALFSPNTFSLRTCHGAQEVTYPFWQLHKAIVHMLDRICGRYLQKRVVSVSEELTQKLEKIFCKDKLVTITNGIDINDVLTRSKEITPIAKQSERIKIAFVGRLVAVKRVELFVKVANALLQQDPSLYEFYIFGDGPLKDKVKDLIKESGHEHAIFLMGFKENVPSYLAAMDLLLVTSLHEGLPMVVLESLALKVPIIATAVGGIPAALDNGNAGTVVAARRPQQEFVSMIKNFALNREPFTLKAEAGFDFVQNRMSANKMAKEYMSLYGAVLK